MRRLLALALLASASPAFAQHPDHGAMDHGAMDHGAMDHGAAAAPAARASGPPRAADAVWGTEVMAPARAALRREVGGMPVYWVQGDRLEWRSSDEGDSYLWDLQAYYGGDLNKLWVKSEGGGESGERPDDAEVQLLWSRAVSPWFDLQTGIRHDFAGPHRTHLVFGAQGLAPYMYELDAAAFLSDQGELTARIEAEFDYRITQRLIAQPRTEISLSAQDIPELGIGAGLDHAELGVRLRYELAREFAPYVGVEYERAFGQSADYARAEGHAAEETRLLAGIRFWF
ncbi:MAG: copper resistance protein CopB [Phenylobacterium sp. RIFCSPHIGHO2_01_FULL_70_10]|nr:MAG: copper resistance protein CopB [Phenylobacterium sp. RIFCSPHIGHO2_01_FULL_70_10]